MIELLLVVALMTLMGLIAVPSMIRSLRGARLRASGRTVVQCHRHARSMAVLQQQQIALLFDTVQNEIEMVRVTVASEGAQGMFLDERAARATAEDGEEAEEDVSAEVTSEMIRKLDTGVSIAEIRSPKRSVEAIDGIFWVNYHANGMSDPYTLTLEDEKGRSMRIEIDGLSGSAVVEDEP